MVFAWHSSTQHVLALAAAAWLLCGCATQYKTFNNMPVTQANAQKAINNGSAQLSNGETLNLARGSTLLGDILCGGHEQGCARMKDVASLTYESEHSDVGGMASNIAKAPFLAGAMLVLFPMIAEPSSGSAGKASETAYSEAKQAGRTWLSGYRHFSFGRSRKTDDFRFKDNFGQPCSEGIDEQTWRSLESDYEAATFVIDNKAQISASCLREAIELVAANVPDASVEFFAYSTSRSAWVRYLCSQDELLSVSIARLSPAVFLDAVAYNIGREEAVALMGGDLEHFFDVTDDALSNLSQVGLETILPSNNCAIDEFDSSYISPQAVQSVSNHLQPFRIHEIEDRVDNYRAGKPILMQAAG